MRRSEHQINHHIVRPRRLVGFMIALWLSSHVMDRSSSTPAMALPAMKAKEPSLSIIGDDAFVARVRFALALLETRCPEAYDQIHRYIPRVYQGEHTGMWAYSDPPTLELGRATFEASPTWLASTIAHESLHSKLYQDCRATGVGNVPPNVWTGTKVEKQCNEYQIVVLRSLRAPAPEILWLNYQDGTHWDTDHDGKSTWSDRWRQNW